MKGILILTGSRELNHAFLRFMVYVFNFKRENIYYFTFKDSGLISPDVISDTDLWMIEGFDPAEPYNPVGWRTARKCGKKVLVFFIERFPLNAEGRTVYDELIKKHFITFNLRDLKNKIKEVMEREKPDLKDFEEVENIWKELKYEPDHHHRRGKG